LNPWIKKKTPVSTPAASNGVICDVKMLNLPKPMPWTVAVARLCLCGAISLKNMSPKTLPVKSFLENGDQQPVFKAA
jgi:hypothetical protein